MIHLIFLVLSAHAITLAERKQLNKEEEVGIVWAPIMLFGAKAVGGLIIGQGVSYAGDAAKSRWGRRALAQKTCFEPKVEGNDMFCPDVASVGTYDLIRKKMFCCSEHMANKYTTQVMSDLMSYEDAMPAVPAPKGAAAGETAVGGFWFALAIPAMKWGAVTTAKAASGYVITNGVNEAGDRVTGRGRLLAEGEFCIDSRVENGETMCPTCLVPTLDMSSGNMACCPSHLADKYMAELFMDLIDSEMGGEMEVGAEETAVGPLWFLAIPAAKFVAVTTCKAAGAYVIKEGVNEAGDRARGRGLSEVDIDMMCYEPKVENGKSMCPTFMVVTKDIVDNQVYCCPKKVAERYTAQVLVSQMDFEDNLEEETAAEAAVGVAEETAVGPLWFLAIPAAKFVAVTTCKAAGAYVIKEGVNEAGDRARGRGLAEDADMMCYTPKVVNGENMCPKWMVPTRDLSDSSLACCPQHIADKYTVQLLNSLEDELDVQEEEVGLVRDLRYHWNTRERYGIPDGRGGYFSEESKVGFYRCPNGYKPTLGGGCVDASNPFKRTPWFFRAEKAVGQGYLGRGYLGRGYLEERSSFAEKGDSGDFNSNSVDDDRDHRPDDSAEELQVSGPSRYDPTGKESRVSGPARVDHWDDPMSMKASADSALEGQTIHKVVQPMLFILAAIGAFTTFNAAAKCLRKKEYTQIHEPEI